MKAFFRLLAVVCFLGTASCSYINPIKVKPELLGDWVYESIEMKVYKNDKLRLDTAFLCTGTEYFSTSERVMYYPNHVEANTYIYEKCYPREIVLPADFEGDMKDLYLKKVMSSSFNPMLEKDMHFTVRFVLKGDRLEIYLIDIFHNCWTKITAKKK
jgi:hypothetical protein